MTIAPDRVTHDRVAHDTADDDPYLDIELDGLRLIEASAGTGKTFTLATLVTRLVVERGLRLGQILAVTFTEAATQELRARLRKRLILAADIASALTVDGGPPRNDDAETALTRRIIQRQLQHEDAAALGARLRRAEREIDLAAVFTIHGFCSRVLTEHALQTGQSFDPPELVGSERELHEELAADLWRAVGADPLDAESLHRLWHGPDVLAKDLGVLLRVPRLLPAAPDDAPDPMPPLQRAAAELRHAFAAHGADLRTMLDAAIAAKVLNGNSYRAELPEALWRSLQAWCDGGDACGEIDPRIDRLTPVRLAEKTNKSQQAHTPASPLCGAIAAFIDANDARGQWLTQRSIGLLHRLRAEAGRRLAQLKHVRRLQTFDDLIDGVADALDGPHGDALVASLRAQYAIALVDEFQDTDARQWAIFRRVFGPGDAGAQADAPAAAPALFLIGDPKQAIYGFRGGDVHTYLAAKRDAAIAPPLFHNFRSRPGLLRAIEALYAQAGDGAFVDGRIRFHAVQPGAGNDDADYQRKGAPAPALTIRVLPAAADGKPGKADDSRALATAACVAEIHAVLTDARSGRATIAGRPVRPGDVAVLVRSHAEATRMQAALVAGGIPAVAAGKQSLFDSEQAKELLAVFDALLQPADEGRLRAALATVLLGIDGAGIARLDGDDAWRRDCQFDALQWRERWQRQGPLALVADLCARHAERLLGLVDGERRLTNLLQLGELLQEADARALGLHGLVDWLRTRIAEADPNDEQQLLRLESDAHRVQILTLHKSKGLEFPLVFLPFVGIGRKDDKPSRHCQVPGEQGRVLHWKAGKDDASERWQHAVMAWEHEQRAEDARLLYVGLTRAEHALWLATGAFYQARSTALAAMVDDLGALRAHADIVFDDRPPEGARLPLPPESARTVPEARHARRTLSRDWWVYSFTQLSNEATGADAAPPAPRSDGIERGGDDEPEPLAAIADAPGVVVDPRYSGSRFGNVLHTALEHVAFAAWRAWRDGALAPAGEDAPLRAALRGEGYADADIDDGVAELTALVGRTLTVALPEGARLCDVPPHARRAEMEFHFALRPTSVEALLATLHAHGVLRGRQGFGMRRTLEGLMTGKIDLVYMHSEIGHGETGHGEIEHGEVQREIGRGVVEPGDNRHDAQTGRYYLLDYKSNRLPAYDAACIARAMDDSEYILQALIYTLALHRWLRFRLGEAYDYARDFGGVRYVFCRGLDAAGAPDTGIYAQQPPLALIDALDALFATGNVAA